MRPLRPASQYFAGSRIQPNWQPDQEHCSSGLLTGLRSCSPMLLSTSVRIASFGITVAILLTGTLLAQQIPPDLVQRVDAAEFAREANLGSYTVTEHYSVFRN